MFSHFLRHDAPFKYNVAANCFQGTTKNSHTDAKNLAQFSDS